MNNPDIKKVAKSEKLEEAYIKKCVNDGSIVIFHNPIHKNCIPVAVGKGTRTKVNANIGTSQDFPDLKNELKKLEICIKYKADTVMDLSTGGDIDKIRREIIKNSPLPVGTVPVYQAVIEAGGIEKLTPDILFDVIERHARDGVDFMTIHSGITLSVADKIAKKKRLMGIVSRGGALLFAWMQKYNKENPLFSEYDRLLKIFKKHNVALSLGDGLRPGSIYDAGDYAQIAELKTLGKLAARARNAGVQVIIEGPGHVPINDIAEQMRLEKKICGGAPFYILGPLPTDIAAGYDHITSAIGGAIASAAGADYICYVTPAEHLGLPSIDDVKEGIIASRIAGHIGDIAKGVKDAKEKDLKMSKARRSLNWAEQIKLSMDPEKAKRYHRSHIFQSDDLCTMCGDFCAMKVSKEAMK